MTDVDIDQLKAHRDAVDGVAAGLLQFANSAVPVLQAAGQYFQNLIDQAQPPAASSWPTAVPVRYGRMLYAPDTTYSIQQQVDKWPVQVLLGDQGHAAQAAQLRAYPGTLQMRAATPVARRKGDKFGAGVCLPPDRIPDEWMLRNKAGEIIRRTRDGDEFVDPGNLAYQNASAAFLIDTCHTQGWPTVWFDEANPKASFSFSDNQSTNPAKDAPTKYPTDESYAAAIRSFIKNVGTQLRKAGIGVWVNLSAQFDWRTGLWDSWSKGIASETDGHTFEFFVGRGHEPTASLENLYWTPMLEWLTWQATTPTRAMFNVQTLDPRVVEYGLATYLLAAGPNTVFAAGLDPYRVDQTVWTTAMVLARKLGKPLGPYRVTAAGLYTRLFEHGLVSVNPSERNTVSGMLPLTGSISPN